MEVLYTSLWDNLLRPIFFSQSLSLKQQTLQQFAPLVSSCDFYHRPWLYSLNILQLSLSLYRYLRFPPEILKHILFLMPFNLCIYYAQYFCRHHYTTAFVLRDMQHYWKYHNESCFKFPVQRACDSYSWYCATERSCSKILVKWIDSFASVLLYTQLLQLENIFPFFTLISFFSYHDPQNVCMNSPSQYSWYILTCLAFLQI